MGIVKPLSENTELSTIERGSTILSRLFGVGEQKEEFIESSLMGKMTFPLLKQGCLELTSVHRRETDVGRCWMRRARNRPGTASASRVCSRNRPEPTCIVFRHQDRSASPTS